MVAPTRFRSMLETKAYPLDFAALISAGAIGTSVQMLVSRTAPYPLQPTTLAAPVAIADGTISLNANPGVGAYLILDPGAGNEESCKVLSIAGSAPWVCTVKPVAWATHTISGPVSYEPGMNTRLCVNANPTPSGTLVTPYLQKGAHGQKYRVSYFITCNNGEEREDEFTMEVLDKAAAETHIKQPLETVFIAGMFDKPMEEPHQEGATISSGVAYVSSNLNTSVANLAAQANAGSSTITLNAHPGIGAMLILTPAGLLTSNNPAERVYVSNVTGAGPTYTVTVLPDLEFQHSNGADVTVYQGFNGAFLSSTTATSIQGKNVVHLARRGQKDKTLKVVWLATTSQAEVLQTTGLASLQEI